MANLQSNLKVITSNTAPTTDNLQKGAMAFGKVNDAYKIYGNSTGTEVHEFLTLSTGDQAKLANVPANTNQALAEKANQTALGALTEKVNVKADQATVASLTETVNGKLDSVKAGTNVVINTDDPNNPIINVASVELPDKYSSTESWTGNVGSSKTGLDYNALTGIGTSSHADVGDTVVFANGVQAQITAVDESDQKTYDVIIVSTPIATSWGSIAGLIGNQTDLKGELDKKANKEDVPTVKDSTVNIKEGNSVIGSFTLNGNGGAITRNIFTSTAKGSSATGKTTTVDTSTLTVVDGTGIAKAGDLVSFADYRIGKVVSITKSTATVAIVYAPKPQDATSWGNITGTLTSQVDLKNALDLKADKDKLPTVNDATITVKDGGKTVATFTLNQASETTIDLPVPTLVVQEI